MIRPAIVIIAAVLLGSVAAFAQMNPNIGQNAKYYVK